MEKIGVICEYNPFHNGHKEQLMQIRREFPDSAIVCLMSGNFVQRGECAVYPKYLRAKAAVAEGADLVFELPYPWCCSGAENFARGAVSILGALGIDRICFGSESGDLEALKTTAERLESERFLQAVVQDQEKEKNESYARQHLRIYRALYGEGFPVRPNDILAVCYLRAIRTLGLKLEAWTYPRSSPYSATEARRALRDRNEEAISRLIPAVSCEMTKDAPLCPALLASETVLPFFSLYSGDVEALCSLDGMSPGLPSRMKKHAMKAKDTAELVASLTSRLDTAAKIKRAILSCLLQTGRDLPRTEPLFTLLLAASEAGCRTLKEIKKNASIRVLTRPAEGKKLSGSAGEQFSLASRADYLYATAIGIPAADTMRQTPYIASSAESLANVKKDK